ncbi:DUF881 domain-containing protein [Jatrophihabitans sp. YIM 134969]
MPDAEEHHGRHEQPPPEPEETDTGAESTVTRPRPSSHRVAGVLIGVLLALLGFGIAVQVRSSSGDTLADARQDDLIRILDDQNSRADRLRQQLAQLRTTEQQLQASGDKDSVAYAQAEQQLTALRVLLGIVPATGPGVRLTITDPDDQLGAEDLLDIVQELRGAGAEAIQFDDVRIGTDSAFMPSATGDGPPQLDGTTLTAPYEILAIGDPPTLDRALNIFGGVAATVRAKGGQVAIVQETRVDVTATRPLPSTALATPSR